MKSSHLVIFSTSGKVITKFNVLPCISSSETLFLDRGQGSNTNHLDQFICVSGSTYRFQSLYQINRKDLNKGKCVKADDNAGNIHIRTG